MKRYKVKFKDKPWASGRWYQGLEQSIILTAETLVQAVETFKRIKPNGQVLDVTRS